MRAYLLNDWQSWRVLTEKPEKESGALCYTENPFLYESLAREGYGVESPAALISCEIEDDLASRVLAATRVWRKIINRHPAGDEAKPDWGRALGRNLFIFLNVVYFRAAQLHELLRRHEKLVVPVLEGDPQNRPRERVGRLVHFHCNYYALIAAFLEPSYRDEKLSIIRSDSGMAAVSRRFPGKPERLQATDKARLFALRFLAHERLILPKLGLRWGIAKSPRAGGKTARVFTESEYVVDVLPELKKAGYAVERFLAPAVAKPERDFSAAEEGLADELAAGLADFLPASETGIFIAAARFAAARVASYFYSKLVPAAETHAAIFGKAPPSAGRTVFLSNGIYDPEEALFQQEASRRGLPFVTFEHGGMGLTRIDTKAVLFSDKENCDAYVAHNEYEVRFYRELTGDAETPVFVRGVAGLTRPVSRRVSRALGRSFLGMPRGRRLTLYCPTRFREDSLWIGYETRDVAYWHFIKDMIASVFSVCDADFFVKLHQKGWRPAQNAIYQLRRHPLEIADLPRNVRFGTFPQLNYLRWAADVIVIDRASSTIQWALTEEIPMVYLDLPFNPLMDEAREEMRKSVFYVDARDGGWREALRGILGLPAEKLKSDWSEKAAARAVFRERYVFGPRRDAGFAAWVDGVVPRARKAG